MPNSRLALAVGLFVLAFAGRARAQQPVQGYALDRLYLSAPGGGWIVMDALDMHGGFGGAMELTMRYAHDPLRLSSGAQGFAIVSDQAAADFGFALTYDRFRIYLNMAPPLGSGGECSVQPNGVCAIGGNQFASPALDLSSYPDMLGDARIGFDARIVGKPASPFRLGAGMQLFIPNGNAGSYVTDTTYRAMLRALVAGDYGLLTWAGQLGVHIRPRDDTPIPDSPRGPELLFGAAAGARFFLTDKHNSAVVVGPEIFGATAFESFFGSATSLEGVLSARYEGAKDPGPHLRVKLGAGAGFVDHLGAPEWRLVLAVEVFDHSEPEEAAIAARR